MTLSVEEARKYTEGYEFQHQQYLSYKMSVDEAIEFRALNGKSRCVVLVPHLEKESVKKKYTELGYRISYECITPNGDILEISW